jgi:hypothetical protein
MDSCLTQITESDKIPIQWDTHCDNCGTHVGGLFASESPKFNQEEFKKMAKEGADTWADVPNASDWVEDLRNGN